MSQSQKILVRSLEVHKGFAEVDDRRQTEVKTLWNLMMADKEMGQGV